MAISTPPASTTSPNPLTRKPSNLSELLGTKRWVPINEGTNSHIQLIGGATPNQVKASLSKNGVDADQFQFKSTTQTYTTYNPLTDKPYKTPSQRTILEVKGPTKLIKILQANVQKLLK
jgi:hypothetical protein